MAFARYRSDQPAAGLSAGGGLGGLAMVHARTSCSSWLGGSFIKAGMI